MKKRLLTALAGITVAVGWMCTVYTPLYSIILGIVSAIGVYELLRVFGVKNKIFSALCLLLGCGLVVYADYRDKLSLPFFPCAAAVIILSLIIMLSDYKELKFEQTVCCLFGAWAIPSALSSVIYFRDIYLTRSDLFTKSDGIFLILFAFFCAWITDGFALFAGMAFGKHKLAPVISPKKTIEGAIGGVIGNTILCCLLWLIFHSKFGLAEIIKLPYVIICALVLSVFSIFGDLAASAIKRHQGIKDFGNILPGHGGMMDRFDSALFVFPLLYLILLIAGKYI